MATFGASGAPAFGASSAPAFGASSTSAFGQSSPAFGSVYTPAFGNTPSPFGAHSSIFGAQSTTPTFCSTCFTQSPFGTRFGSRAVPYTSTDEADGGVGGQAPAKLISISAMLRYDKKNQEELRWEDYQLGDKGGIPAASPFSQPALSSPFSQTSAANPFPSPLCSIFANTSSPFGAAALGTSTSPFGASSSPYSSALSTSSAFGVASSSSPFGVSSAPAFFSTPFGQAFQPGPLFSSIPSLGSSVFGTSTPLGQSKPAFGLSTPSFGQSTLTFGSTSSSGASNIAAIEALRTSTSSFRFGSTSKNKNSGCVVTVLSRLDEVTAERERLRLELDAMRVAKESAMAERDNLRTQLEAERAQGRDGNGIVVAVLEWQLRQAQQDAQYHAGEASYYHGLLLTHAPAAQVTPYSNVVSQQHSQSRGSMGSAQRVSVGQPGGGEGSAGHEDQGESSNRPQQDPPQQ